MTNDLIKLAIYLDKSGHHSEANYLTSIIKKEAGIKFNNIELNIMLELGKKLGAFKSFGFFIDAHEGDGMQKYVTAEVARGWRRHYSPSTWTKTGLITKGLCFQIRYDLFIDSKPAINYFLKGDREKSSEQAKEGFSSKKFLNRVETKVGEILDGQRDKWIGIYGKVGGKLRLEDIPSGFKVRVKVNDKMPYLLDYCVKFVYK